MKHLFLKITLIVTIATPVAARAQFGSGAKTRAISIPKR